MLDKDGYKILIISSNENVISQVNDSFNQDLSFYTIVSSEKGDLAFDTIDEEKPDLILYDSTCRSYENFNFIDELKSFEDTRGIPIISIISETSQIQKSFYAGAVDFIKIPLNEIELSIRIKSILSLYKLLESISEQAELLEFQSDTLEKQKQHLEIEKKKTDDLLLNILPYEIAEQLKNKGRVDAKKYRRASVLFTDFKGFTRISSELEPEEIIEELSIYFSKFDNIIGKHYIEKIKTIGDAYMCVGGLPLRNKSNPIDTVLAGLKMQKFVKEYNAQKEAEGKTPWEIRVGIHTGKVVAGVIGSKKFAYDIWGDAVNTASRMETASEPGKVNISETTYKFIKDYFDCTYRGKIIAKNKGEIDMYFVNGLKPEYCEIDDDSMPNDKFKQILSEY